jgi:thermitase
LEALGRNPNIEFAERDPVAQALLVPNDPHYGSQWHLPKINAPAAWDLGTGDRNTVIAVLDTGVAYSHPDLKGKVLQGYNFIGNNTNAADDQGHGTLVAGAAAAISNNSAGVSGVAWQNLILPVKVLDANGSGSHSAIANGIVYAADQGARVINLSLGSTSGSSTLESAVKYAWNKNAVLVAAAGNNGNNTLVYPAAYGQVIGVSGLTSSDVLATWSSYGTHVSLAAPGANILTTTMSGSYGYASGTSLASPLVAGVAGLVAAATPELLNGEVREVVEKTATDLGAAGFDTLYGNGRVNAAAAVKEGLNRKVSDITAPQVAISSPAASATVSGVVDVLVDATDNVGVTKLEFYVNASRLASTTASSAAFVWDTRALADGSYTLEARAYDAAGNAGYSAKVTVKVANSAADTTAPTVAIISPSDGSTVTKTVSIKVAASDNVGVARVDLFINGKHFASSTSSTPTFSWNTAKYAKGTHLIQALARDAAGNGSVASIQVTKK